MFFHPLWIFVAVSAKGQGLGFRCSSSSAKHNPEQTLSWGQVGLVQVGKLWNNLVRSIPVLADGERAEAAAAHTGRAQDWGLQHLHPFGQVFPLTLTVKMGFLVLGGNFPWFGLCQLTLVLSLVLLSKSSSILLFLKIQPCNFILLGCLRPSMPHQVWKPTILALVWKMQVCCTKVVTKIFGTI